MGVRIGQWPWFAILARSGCEKTATLLLENAGYECFYPLSRFTRNKSGRMEEIVEVPLFPRYFFCRMNPHNRLPVLITPGVMQIVGVGETPIPVDEEELTAIRRAGISSLPVMSWPYLETGRMERLEGGPLAGMTGIAIKLKSGMKLVLSVSLLRRSVAIEIDRNWLKKATSVHPLLSGIRREVVSGSQRTRM
jgi:transcription antitermination factor NusG